MRYQLWRLRRNQLSKVVGRKNSCHISVPITAAFEVKGSFLLLTGGSIPPKKESLVLESVTILSDDDQVNITCRFRNDSSPSKRCVVVSRKSTESVLMVVDYSMSIEFPVTLPLSEPGNYSVAVFGWSDGVIECLPAEIQQVDIVQGNLY